jgi:hypothetical protein
VFPGCTVPSEQADVDHTEDHAYGGDTVPENLAPLSQAHHRVKHHTRWQITQNGDDTLTATSPAGYQYTVRPEGRMRPAPKQLIDASTAAFTAVVRSEAAIVAGQAVAKRATEPEEDLAGCPF